MPGEDDEVVARANARVGMLVKGKYTLDRVLGIGGMATVYAATHRNGKEFAVKVLHAELSMRSDTRTRFLREGYLANRVSHPGAVAVLDDDVADDGAAFLVMELLHGQTLDAIWERQNCRLPLPFVAGAGLQLLDVLAAAHARGLVHRDIKPGNLMMTQDGTVKVLDFGIARLRDFAAASSTQTGIVMGTPAFMAPEQALAKTEEIDAQTDVWAVGATLFTLASGQLVHEGDNSQQILIKAATARARPFAEVMPRAPAALCQVIDRALSFDKSERWLSAVEMREALKGASRQAFGAIPTAASVAAILDELDEHGKTRVLGPSDVSRVLALVSGSRSGTVAPRRSANAGAVTAEAVASDSVVQQAMPKSRGGTAGAIAVALLGIGGLIFFAVRGGSPTSSKTLPTASSASAVAVPPVVASVSAPASTSTWTPVAPTAPAETAEPIAPPRPVPVATQAVKRTATPPAVVAPTPPVTPAPAAKPRCDPPYEFDDKGNKRWKRECL